MDQIKTLRKIIDSIDDQILDLIKSRADLVEEIGEIKKISKIEVVDEKRESEIFDKLISKASSKSIDPESIKKIWQILIDMSYTLEGKENANS